MSGTSHSNPTLACRERRKKLESLRHLLLEIVISENCDMYVIGHIGLSLVQFKLYLSVFSCMGAFFMLETKLFRFATNVSAKTVDCQFIS